MSVIKPKFIICWVVILVGLLIMQTILVEHGLKWEHWGYGLVGGLLFGIFMLLTRLDELGKLLDRFLKT